MSAIIVYIVCSVTIDAMEFIRHVLSRRDLFPFPFVPLFKKGSMRYGEYGSMFLISPFKVFFLRFLSFVVKCSLDGRTGLWLYVLLLLLDGCCHLHPRLIRMCPFSQFFSRLFGVCVQCTEFFFFFYFSFWLFHSLMVHQSAASLFRTCIMVMVECCGSILWPILY